ncbi:N-(5'-phosphoribosyl)anthranilate isomerase [[Bacillus] enclensis]|uniref:N-(5'-phosphoribosyl)anthranilate isomerase n=1 Tax=[Bacillus] enclensis TaxID=1402860 RepID=A0A0V8HLC4_9BACI|nr:phosphoribosylanthranilate isomerase [[Bacillus] enclensis]KSU63300.1 N-(5'-phosphoribosyl)anthranilate isomerase [[Bacillus] enclensis]MBH9964678.1 phosphoribosylanthranilate isomerase [[Bacillus] enclensis]SCB81554.1 phosphoribosylanthranilate isomerase [[Bacillus] enclensis]
MTKVKVCGIREREEAKWAADAGADAVGFVFAESKRRVTLEKAADIADSLPKDILKIGVFVNASESELQYAMDVVKLDYVQLHGDETPEFCRELTIPFIKAISIREKSDLQALQRYGSGLLLVDSGKGPFRGGNGTTFDWEYLSDYESLKDNIILAGGLKKENVTEAIKKTEPYMVDVSSGVERNGRKDCKMIKAFIEEVKSFQKEESGEYS